MTLDDPKSDLIESIRNKILTFFNALEKEEIPYHNYKHSAEVAQLAKELASTDVRSPLEIESIVAAAWFVDVGYYTDDQRPQEAMEAWAIAALQKMGIGKHRIEEIVRLMGHGVSKPNEMGLGAYLNDALVGIEHERRYKRKLGFDLEVAKPKKNYPGELAWYKRRLELLRGQVLLTHAGKLRFSDALSQNKRTLISLIKAAEIGEEQVKDIKNTVLPFEGIEEGIPERGIQTYFRTNYRNHINLSAIADNKANIMISVNAIVISILISILSYKELSDQSPEIGRAHV